MCEMCDFGVCVSCGMCNAYDKVMCEVYVMCVMCAVRHFSQQLFRFVLYITMHLSIIEITITFAYFIFSYFMPVVGRSR